MTTVVTGASGHVGANLVRTLLKGGRPVRVLLHRDQRGIEGLDVEKVSGDICDSETLTRVFKGAEVVYHLAAHISLSMNDWPLVGRINVGGTRNVVEACLRSGVKRLVHFSTIHALEQRPLCEPVDESRPLIDSRSCPPYELSKAAGEREVLEGIEQGLDAVIITPTAMIGPHDYRPSHIGEALLALSQGKLPALVDGGYDWVDVRDVIDGALKAEKKAPTGAKYILSGCWASIHEVASLIEDFTGTSAPRFVAPMWLANIGLPFAFAFSKMTGRRQLYTRVSMKALCSNHNVSCQRASSDLDYHPRPLQETVKDTIHWFQENGYLVSSNERRPLEVR